jgi:hypothetical protein
VRVHVNFEHRWIFAIRQRYGFVEEGERRCEIIHKLGERAVK